MAQANPDYAPRAFCQYKIANQRFTRSAACELSECSLARSGNYFAMGTLKKSQKALQVPIAATTAVSAMLRRKSNPARFEACALRGKGGPAAAGQASASAERSC